MVKKRNSLQVDPDFRIKLTELKRKIEIAEQKDISIRELTKRIANTGTMDAIEQSMLKGNGTQVNFKIKLDKRLFG